MNLLFALCGFGFGFIAGVAVHVLIEYKKREVLEDEVEDLKKREMFLYEVIGYENIDN